MTRPTLDELLERRLYHELSSALLEQLAIAETQTERVTLFRRYVLGLSPAAQSALNPLRVVDLVRQLLKRGDDDGALVLEILDALFPWTSEESPATLFMGSAAAFQAACVRVECLLRLETSDVRELLARLEDAVETQRSLSKYSASEYSRVSGLHAKRVGDLTRLYQHGVQYLASTETEQLQAWILKDAAMAGLLSAEIFDLGAFLGEEKKVRATLGASEAEHLLSVLRAFDAGDIRQFETLLGQQQLQQHGTGAFTKEQVQTLKEKMQLMSLLEICANELAAKQSMSCPFETIATAVGVQRGTSSTGVERLVLRALGGGLMRGRLDQVTQTVRVDWVRPRILDRPRIAGLKTQFQRWADTLRENFQSDDNRHMHLH